jgi:prevent-host-death family protein
MKTASVSELKANLSRYLRDVRRGSEIQILDRGVPIARLTGVGTVAADEGQARRARLAAAGVLRTGSGRVAAVVQSAPMTLPGGLSGAIAEERDDRV